MTPTVQNQNRKFMEEKRLLEYRSPSFRNQACSCRRISGWPLRLHGVIAPFIHRASTWCPDAHKLVASAPNTTAFPTCLTLQQSQSSWQHVIIYCLSRYGSPSSTVSVIFYGYSCDMFTGSLAVVLRLERLFERNNRVARYSQGILLEPTIATAPSR